MATRQQALAAAGPRLQLLSLSQMGLHAAPCCSNRLSISWFAAVMSITSPDECPCSAQAEGFRMFVKDLQHAAQRGAKILITSTCNLDGGLSCATHIHVGSCGSSPGAPHSRKEGCHAQQPESVVWPPVCTRDLTHSGAQRPAVDVLLSTCHPAFTHPLPLQDQKNPLEWTARGSHRLCQLQMSFCVETQVLQVLFCCHRSTDSASRAMQAMAWLAAMNPSQACLA